MGKILSLWSAKVSLIWSTALTFTKLIEILLLIDGLKVSRWLINIINCYVILVIHILHAYEFFALIIFLAVGYTRCLYHRNRTYSVLGRQQKITIACYPIGTYKNERVSLKVTNKFLISIHIFWFCHQHPTPGLKKTEYKIFSCIS